VLLVATTNFPKAVDRALMSRADWIEDIGAPDLEARTEIINEVLEQLATAWSHVADLKRPVGSFVAASEGLDGRRLRKAIATAAGISVETASDLNMLKKEHVLATLKNFIQTQGIEEAA
jgi:pachytene checkpoint protein 2